MKRAFFLLLFCCSISTVLSQTCRYGFSYEISNNSHWGKDKIIITSVYPKSPAERAGIKPFDIIEAVEGVHITDSILDDIEPFLNPKGKEIVELTIKNFSSVDKKVKIKKECYSAYGISEEQLASAFAMYAVEDNQERFFTCPFITSNTQEAVDYSV
ncbi:MAG: PDZ domain-containing protein, partial [Tannerella sp.]|nr:PDZ domain-containing protein [Tannerella sp.]